MRTESEIVIGKPAADVFPWLLDADKVPQWMSGVNAYKPAGGELKVGSKIRQELEISGQRLDFDLEIVELKPPGRALLKFEGSGFDAKNGFTLTPEGDGTRVKWAIEGKPTSIKTKMLASMIETKLQQKQDKDLARLRDLLQG